MELFDEQMKEYEKKLNEVKKDKRFIIVQSPMENFRFGFFLCCFVLLLLLLVYASCLFLLEILFGRISLVCCI